MPNQIKGKTLMFTGTLSVPRHEAQHVVEELGGTAGSSVTKETDYLVCGSDQVGISSKWEKAGLLGVTRVDENFFWDLVKEAKEEAESEEDWSSVKGIVTEEVLFRALEKLRGRKRKVEEYYYPPRESMTYHSSENLNKWPGVSPQLGGRTCPYCKSEIPYSIDRDHWYCFKCGLFSNIGQAEGRHVCTDWERFLGSTNGWYEKCKLCGNVKFVGKEDVDANIDVKRNYVHSLEFAAEVTSIYTKYDRNVEVAANMSDEEREYWWTRFEKWQRRQEAKQVQLSQNQPAI